MTITEFLTARYDEEAFIADIALMLGQTHEHDPDRGNATVTLKWRWGLVVEYSDRSRHAQSLVAGAPTPARVLADIAAKRAIMAEHGDTHECSGPSGGLTFDPALQGDDWGGPCNTLRHLASPYAEHPDFDPAWRV